MHRQSTRGVSIGVYRHQWYLQSHEQSHRGEVMESHQERRGRRRDQLVQQRPAAARCMCITYTNRRTGFCQSSASAASEC